MRKAELTFWAGVLFAAVIGGIVAHLLSAFTLLPPVVGWGLACLSALIAFVLYGITVTKIGL